jgi:lipoprotein-releasing system permease protein
VKFLPSSSEPLLWSIAWRFVYGRRSRLLDGTARAALLATTIGVAAMVVAMALMTGYREDLQARMIKGNAAVVIYPLPSEGLALTGERLEALWAIQGVTAVRRVLYGHGSLSSARYPQGAEVTWRGVDVKDGLPDLGEVRVMENMQISSGLEDQELPGVLVGSELGKRLAAEPGETLRMTVVGFRQGSPHFRYQSVQIAGEFTTGFSEFDQSWAVIDRSRLHSLVGDEAESASTYELGATEPRLAQAIAERARQILGPGYLVTDWQELNRGLFAALEVQQLALFFVLGLIVVVSTFNVASSLVVLIRERMREIGVLAALGLSPQNLQRLFLISGGILGALGTAVGATCGCLIAWTLTEFELIQFDAEVAAVYFISSVPFRISPTDLLWIIGFTLTVTTLACWIAARRAGQVEPAVALRYE